MATDRQGVKILTKQAFKHQTNRGRTRPCMIPQCCCGPIAAIEKFPVRGFTITVLKKITAVKRTTVAAAATIFIMLLHSTLYAGYFEQGSRYFVFKKYDKAREMFLKAVETGDDGNSYYFLGEIEKNEKNYDKALEYYKNAVSHRIQVKYLKLAYWNIIILAERKSDYDAMVKGCRDLWDRLKDHGAKTKVESLINKLLWTENEEAKEKYKNALKLRNEGKTEDAASEFRAALNSDSGFLAPKFELGLLELKKENHAGALRYFTEVADKIPFYGEVHLLLGDIHLRRGSYRDARQHFDRALDLGFLDNATKSTIYLKSATCSYNMRDYERAREDIYKIHSGRQTSLEVLLLSSAISIKKENYQEALKTLERAAAVDPNNTEIPYQIGSIHYRMGNPSYISQFDRLYEMTAASEDEIPAKYYKAFSLLAKALYGKELYSRTEKIIRKLPDSAKDRELRLILAQSLYRQDKLTDAITHFEALNLTDNEDRFMLCRMYARTGNKGKAREILLRLYIYDTYRKKAHADPVLKPLADAIDAEKEKEKEAERIKKTENVEKKP